MPIVFISALVGILNYIKVLPFIIKWLGKGINKLSGMGELEVILQFQQLFWGNLKFF